MVAFDQVPARVRTLQCVGTSGRRIPFAIKIEVRCCAATHTV